jgi:hypothetical protein
MTRKAIAAAGTPRNAPTGIAGFDGIAGELRRGGLSNVSHP